MVPLAHTRVMLVGDHKIMRDGLRELPQRSGDFEVVGEAGDGEAAVRTARSPKPDMIVMDVMMPLENGIDLRTLHDVANGEYRVPANAVRRVFAALRASAQRDKKSDPRRPTQREREILTLSARRLSHAKIAELRGNQQMTVRNAVYGIQNRLGVDTMQELVVWAVRSGLPDDWPSR